MTIIGGENVEQIEPNFNRKQNHKVTIFACLLSAVSIGLLVFGFMAVSSDKVVMLQSVSNLTNKLDYLFQGSESELIDKLATNEDIGIRSSIALSDTEDKFQLDVNFLENKKEKNAKLDVRASSNEDDLLAANIYLESEKAYLNVDGITPRYYYTPVEYDPFISSLSSNDYNKILGMLKDAINDSIEQDNIQKEKTTILYQGKEKKVNKLTYEITNNTLKKMITNFIDSLKNDTELLKNLATYIDISEEEVINKLGSLLDSISSFDFSQKLYYHVYYYGMNKIVLYELASEDMSLQYQVEDKETITLLENQEILFSISVHKNDKQYEFEGYLQSDGTKIGFNGVNKDNQLTITVDTGEAQVKLIIDNQNNIQQNRYQYLLDMKLVAISGTIEQEIIQLSIQSEYYFHEKVDTSEIRDSVDINEISEEEKMEIYENIMNHPLYQLLQEYDFDELSL